MSLIDGSRAAHVRALRYLLASLVLGSSIAPSARADAPTESTEPPPYEMPLTAAQRLSIEHGAADLGGATEQSLLSAVLYVSSAATLLVAIATTIVLYAELTPPGVLPTGIGVGSEGSDAQAAALGTVLACFVAHAVTTPLAIRVGRDAQHRHQRARRELLLTITPFGLTVAGRF